MVLTENFREIEVANLAGNLLGPKYGVREILHEKIHPWKLYLTGVLKSKDSIIKYQPN